MFDYNRQPLVSAGSHSHAGISVNEQQLPAGNELGLYKQRIVQRMKSNEAFIKQSQKLAAAEERRQMLLKLRSNKCKYGNLEKKNKSESFMQNRHKDDFIRKSNSTCLRSVSLQENLITQMHRRMKKKLHEWEIEENFHSRSVVNNAKEEGLRDVHALQALFEDRIAILRESASRCSSNTSFLTAAESALHAAIQDEFVKVLIKFQQQAMVIQSDKNDRHIASFSCMRSMSNGSWVDSLRDY